MKARGQLHPNFPNPFNPDTWIPYTLATRRQVTIRIYDVGGRVVRVLDLGVKGAGEYGTREEAAHWDGRLEDGTPAVSGVYVAELDLDPRQSFRRMVLSR